MTQTTKTEIVAIADVVAALNKASKAATNMLTFCRQAADIASSQLDMTEEPKSRVQTVVSAYNAQFAGADHNVKANFVAFLTLHAFPDAPITTVSKVDGEKVDNHTTAGEILAKPISKHTLRDVAKQVREHAGTARKVTPKPTAKPATAAPVASEMDAFSAWLDNLEEYLSDSVYHGKVVARLIEAGYTLGKATKGTKVKGKASA
jgi:hypothetical protein